MSKVVRLKIEDRVRDLLTQYHLFHGDFNVRCVMAFMTAKGYACYLMRFSNRAGVRYSSIDMVSLGDEETYYVTEYFSEKRERERGMVKHAINFFKQA